MLGLCMLDAEIKGSDITSRPLGSTEPENWVQLPATCLEFPLTASSTPRPPALFSQPSQHLANDGRSSTAQTSSRLMTWCWEVWLVELLSFC